MSPETKAEIRKKILKDLRNQKEEDRFKKSLVILEKLFAIPEFQRARTILFYASFDGEVDTFEMMTRSLKLGKNVALPTILSEEKKILPTLIHNCEKDLEHGPYGIKQPRPSAGAAISPDKIDLCIVPGLAFDRRNHRLGRGAGYYDRFLADLSRRTPTVGLAFDFQVVAVLPNQEHDVPLDRVITN